MRKADREAILIFPFLLLLSFLLAMAGSQGGILVFGIYLYSLLVVVAFVIQFLAFIPSFLHQTEKAFDLTGSLTYIALVAVSVLLSPEPDARSILLAILVVLWAARLGLFLFTRIQKVGKDDRFDDLKPSFFRFLNVWVVQGLWITFTSASALIAITSTTHRELDVFAWIGLVVWVIGFVIEVMADEQKRRFNARPENAGKFINTGLWSRSRHPNYFGEILLWIGITIIAIPVLRGWQWVALISPVFVTLLLTRLSGIPLLERKANQRWGGREDYEAYKADTPILIPRI